MTIKELPAFCINLERRKDRRQLMEKEFAKVGLSPTFINGADIKPGWVGCRESHLAILDDAWLGDVFVVFEDDVQFLQDLSIVDKALSQLPEDWDMLYLGASPKQPQVRYSDNLIRLNNAHVTHAIIWHYREGGALEYILDHANEVKKIDDYFATVIQPKFNCFVTYPMAATQTSAGGNSDTCKYVDLSSIVRYYNKHVR